MEGAKSQFSEVTLPTGVMVDEQIHQMILFRELSGIEEDILASKKMSVSKKITHVLANCIMKFGTIEDRKSINEMVTKMTMADRIYYLIQLRMASVSPNVEFESECPSCNHVDKKVFELKQITMSNAPKANALFKEIVLPSSQAKVRFHVGDGNTEEAIEKATNDTNAVTLALFARTDSFNDRPPAMVDIRNLSSRDRSALRNNIDELEGDLDDNFKAQCPQCGHDYEAGVPISGVDFFFQ